MNSPLQIYPVKFIARYCNNRVICIEPELYAYYLSYIHITQRYMHKRKLYTYYLSYMYIT